MSQPDAAPAPDANDRERLTEVTLDETSIRRSNSAIEHEREVAIYDLLDANSFALVGRDEGPYKLALSIAEDRLVLTVGNETSSNLVTHVLSLSPLRRIIRDYFIVCDSYYQAIRTAPPSKIQVRAAAFCASAWTARSRSTMTPRAGCSR